MPVPRDPARLPCQRGQYTERQEAQPLAIDADRQVHMGAVDIVSIGAKDVADLGAPGGKQQREQAHPACAKQLARAMQARAARLESARQYQYQMWRQHLLHSR